MPNTDHYIGLLRQVAGDDPPTTRARLDKDWMGRGGSQPRRWTCGDDYDYAVKHPNNPQVAGATHLLATEFVVARVGLAMGAPVFPCAVVDVAPELVRGITYPAGVEIAPGRAFGSRLRREGDVVDADVATADWKTSEANRKRAAALCVLHALLIVGDSPQFVVRKAPPYEFWSVDHGYFIAGGSPWPPDLAARSDVSDILTGLFPELRLTPDDVRAAALPLLQLSDDQVARCVAPMPAYSVLRYVPRPERGEFVNFGVVVVREDGEDAAAEFTPDWRRARALGRPEDVRFLERLSNAWKRELRAPSELGKLFPDRPFNSAWLAHLHETTANLVQVSEPRKALATGVDELARELFETFVGARRPTTPRRTTTKRGLQLAFEGELRRSGRVAYERNFTADGADVRDWRFDYAVKNGRPLHFVQTMNLNLEDTKAVLSDATYVAYARRDLRRSETFADVPISVIAEPPDAERSELVDETESILSQDEVALIMRSRVPEFVERLAIVADPVIAS